MVFCASSLSASGSPSRSLRGVSIGPELGEPARLARVRSAYPSAGARAGGAIGAHAAMKYLVPLARANLDDCVRLAKAVAPLGLSNRQIGSSMHLSFRQCEGASSFACAPARPRCTRRGIDTRGEPGGQAPDDLHIVTAVARRAHARPGARRGRRRGGRRTGKRAPRVRNAHEESLRDKKRCDREMAMLDETTRTAILKLHEQGHGTRTIALVLGVSRKRGQEGAGARHERGTPRRPARARRAASGRHLVVICILQG